jgi:hypothetical protein
VERGVATSRLLPVAFACIIGALTLFSGPTGIASIGALLVAIGPLRTILHRRSRQFGLLPLLAPIMAAATVTIILIFRDQTLVGEVQANMLKSAVGPSLSWFDEHIRYERLFMASPDGSIARRFAVLALLVALAVSVAMMLRRGHIPAPRAPQPPHHRHHDHLVPGDDVHPDQVDAPLRVFAGLAGCWYAGGGRRHRARAAVQTQPRGVRRPGAVRHRAVVRQRQRLVVRIQLRCPVVEPVPGVALRVHHDAAGADRRHAGRGGLVPLSGRAETGRSGRGGGRRRSARRWPSWPGCWCSSRCCR